MLFFDSLTRKTMNFSFSSAGVLVIVVGVAVSCFLIVTGSDGNVKTNSGLRLIAAVFRHGQRTPASTYPTDPHINEELFPMGWGALTNEGKLQQFELGNFLRNRYKNFLSDIYSPKYIYAQSSDVDRTKMSLQLVLAGLYPPTKIQQWNSALIWQPIPIHFEPYNEDKLIMVAIPCPRYYEALEEVSKLDEVKNQLKESEGIYSYITNHSGMEVKTFNDLLSIHGTLRAESDLNLDLPEWTAKVYPEPLTKLAARSFILNDYTPELRKLKGGPLLKRILNTFIAKANNTLKPEQQQLHLYAGHDSTIAHLLSALNVWDEQLPEYNSLILLELHEVDKNQHGLKIFFRNSTTQEPYLLKIPGCDEICPLEQVTLATKNVIPSDLKEECKPKDPNYEPTDTPEI
ncbi:testicular acid phosphatase homolog [Lycorma delicatula]|uniref:testicular acid phosphatase homolog n=1 Tax=Lycorma delicatula TaxID=130591 RepID=UPI003F510A71